MKIEGLQADSKGDQRVFGSYGPGVPRDVLSDLLNGSGYNVMMLGVTPSGVPRELALTVRTGGGVPSPPSRNTNAMEGANENDEAFRPTQYPDEQTPQPPPPPITPGGANRVKSPQEMLRELQRLRDQQQQEQQQQPSEGYSLPSDDSQPN